MAKMTFAGMTLEHSADGGTTWTQVRGVTSYDDSGATRAEIDATDSDSTAKEYLLDIPDNGTQSFGINLDFADGGQDAVRTAEAAGDLDDYRVTFADASTLQYSAYVTNFSKTGSNGSIMTGNLTLRISGAVTGTAV